MPSRISPSGRVSLRVPYAVCLLATWSLLGLHSTLRTGDVLAALALQLLVGLVLPWAYRWPPDDPRVLAAQFCFITSVALLRNGVWPTPGFTPLLLLPIVWGALRGSRLELGAAVAASSVTLFAPIVVIGGAHYPTSAWRAGVIMTVTATVVGVTVLGLVERLRDSERRHRAQATTDPLTGLANHRAFQQRLAAELERSARHGRSLSLAIFDIDHFKSVNDTHGHPAGDGVLADVAARLAGCVRRGEMVARTGGEEFCWIMPETDGAGAFEAAERARRRIAGSPFAHVGTLTISAGVCSREELDGRGLDLIGAADQALYDSKRGGRNRTTRFGAVVPQTRAAVLP
jgi:diguanylate cyclase (GGDEF)-like protein